MSSFVKPLVAIWQWSSPHICTKYHMKLVNDYPDGCNAAGRCSIDWRLAAFAFVVMASQTLYTVQVSREDQSELS